MVKKKETTIGESIIFWIINLVGIAYMIIPIDFAPFTGLDDGAVGFYIFNRIKNRYWK